ncbi:hypothetical protein GCM10010466_58330 [Planomonospora alba]|uniref:Uncharacterized protein n=1 Tax=Planomonospora alba TaxID=161354 RepID=A0ABP6P1C5_9ACTN
MPPYGRVVRDRPRCGRDTGGVPVARERAARAGPARPGAGAPLEILEMMIYGLSYPYVAVCHSVIRREDARTGAAPPVVAASGAAVLSGSVLRLASTEPAGERAGRPARR